MEISAWELYWILKLDGIRQLVAGMAGLSVISSLVCLMVVGLSWDQDKPKIQKRFLRALWVTVPIAVLSVLAAVFTPTTRQMAAIYIVPKLSRSDFVQKDIPKEGRELYGLLKQYLEQQVKGKEPKSGKENP